MLNFLHTKNLDIEKQLKIEKDLLDSDQNNWCIINEGTSDAIVLGVNSKQQEHINLYLSTKNNINIIRRFSGGGTVFVDKDTIFITFIFSKNEDSSLIYPEPIMRFLEKFYIEAFQIKDFKLLDNDFVIKNKKCGGNAQYIKKNRWLHHTSFLWNYTPVNMNYLLYPPKTPEYRKSRSHEDFLEPLSKHVINKSILINLLKNRLKKDYILKEVALGSIL